MKKILLSVFALLLCLFVLASCGKQENEGEGQQQQKTAAEQAVEALTVEGAQANPDYTYHAVGGWGAWDPTDDNQMTMTTVAAVKAWNSAIGAKLEAAGAKYVAFRLIEMGTAGAGWDAKAMDGDVRKDYDGCYTVKVIKSAWDEDSEMHLKSQWIPDPRTAHTEALTDNLFVPVWTEAVDANGFSWADNSVVISGAGQYILIFADYGKASTADVFGYGYGLVKVGDVTLGEDVLPTTVAPVEPAGGEGGEGEGGEGGEGGEEGPKVYSLIGNFNDWKADVDMTEGEGGIFTAVLEAQADTEFKIRVNHDWDENYGGTLADGACTGEQGGGNMKPGAGTWLVSFNPETLAITVTAQE